MTKKKKEKPSSTLTDEKKLDHVAEALGNLLPKDSGDGFWSKARKVFFGTVYCLAVAVFSCIFGILAAILLPIVLPLAYVVGKFMRREEFPKAMT